LGTISTTSRGVGGASDLVQAVEPIPSVRKARSDRNSERIRVLLDRYRASGCLGDLALEGLEELGIAVLQDGLRSDLAWVINDINLFLVQINLRLLDRITTMKT
jgi:hypothetical protein